MIKVLLFDLSYTLLFPKDESYHEELNKLHAKLSEKGGYDYDSYYYLDLELLRFLKKLRDKFKLYVYTSGNIQDIPEFRKKLDEVFEDIFSASELGISKKDPGSYKTITKKIGVEPDEVLFIDDSIANCEAARSEGLNVHRYVGHGELIKYILSLWA